MKTLLFAAIVIASLSLFLPKACLADSCSTSSNNALSISGPTSAVTPGSSFAVDVNICNATDLYDFELDLSFDPTLLEATGVSEGSFLPGGGSTFFIPGTIDNTGGTVTLNADTLLTAISGVDGDGTLLVIDFTALNPGTSALTIEDNSDLFLQDSVGDILSETITNGSVTVEGSTAVPEPSSLVLLLIGLLGLVALIRPTRPSKLFDNLTV